MLDFSSAAAAGVAGGLNILGGFLSRPDLSQRDLMYTQRDIWADMMRKRYKLQRQSLKSAGYNPMLAINQAPPGPQAGAAPMPFKDPVGEGVSQAGASAREAWMAGQQTKQIKAQVVKAEADAEKAKAQAVEATASAGLKDQQRLTEPEKRWTLQAQASQAHSAAEWNRAKTLETKVNTELKKMEIPLKERDQLIASVDKYLYAGDKGPLMRMLEKGGVTGLAAKGLVQALDQLRGLLDF